MPGDGRDTTKWPSNPDHRLDHRAREGTILAISTRQHGPVGHDQLTGLGLSESAIRSRVAAGALHRLHHGVYAPGRPDVPLKGHWMAAVLACSDDALLSHRAAAGLHDLLTWTGGRIDVTIPRRSALSRPGIRVHRVTTLTAADRAEVANIPCTAVSRTLLDLAATAPRHLLECACDQAERLRSLDTRAIEELLARLAGQPGTACLAAVLETAQSGEGGPRTELERRFLSLCRRTGLPMPSVNEWMAIDGEEMQCDFVWHAQRVIAEVDG